MPRLLEKAAAGIHFARSLSGFRAGRPRPMSAVFVVCNRCNLTCRYCNSPFMDARELSLGEIHILFANLRHTGVFRLGLTGGEPLLRDDMGEIISLARDMGFFVSLNSNLLLYSKRPEIFSGVRFVFTSLDGSPGVHERNRGKKSGDGVIEAIRDLRRRKIPVVAITVVDTQEYHSLEELIDLAERYDFRLHFQIRGASENPTQKTLIRGSLAPDFDNEAYRTIWRKLTERKKTSRAIANSRRYLESVVSWPDYRRFSRTTPGGRCAAGFGFLFIASDGTGYPCGIIKDQTTGIDMLTQSWVEKFEDRKPCNDCICGPYLEFNLLYREPVRTVVDMLSGYARR